jgi:hypothetical protein
MMHMMGCSARGVSYPAPVLSSCLQCRTRPGCLRGPLPSTAQCKQLVEGGIILLDGLATACTRAAIVVGRPWTGLIIDTASQAPAVQVRRACEDCDSPSEKSL